jgi:hypothetical protein
MMNKNLAEAVRNIIESVITMKKEYSNQHWPSYTMEPNPYLDDSFVIRVNFHFKNEMLLVATFIESFGTLHVNVKDNYDIEIS